MVIGTNRRSLLIGLGASVAGLALTPHLGRAQTAATATAPSEGLAAPVLSLASGKTSYPPEVDFDRPIDWQDGDNAVMQRSQDPTFATGASEAVQTLSASATSYAFGLSSVTSGTWYFRMAAWRGTRPAQLNWSNIVGVGNSAAPAITTAAAFTVEDGRKVSIPLSANQPACTFAVEGVDGGNFEVAGAPGSQVLRMMGDGSPSILKTSTYRITLVASNAMGVASTKDVTITVHSDSVYLSPTARNRYVQVGDGNLSATGNAYVGFAQGVRGTGKANAFSVRVTGGETGTGGVLALGFDDQSVDLDAHPETIGRGDTHGIGMIIGNFGFEVWAKSKLLSWQYSKGWKIDTKTIARVVRNPATGDITFSLSFDAGKSWTVIHKVTGADAKLERYYPVLAVFTNTTVTANFKG